MRLIAIVPAFIAVLRPSVKKNTFVYYFKLLDWFSFGCMLYSRQFYAISSFVFASIKGLSASFYHFKCIVIVGHGIALHLM